MYIVFISLNKVWTDEMKKLFGVQESIRIIHGKVEDLPRANTTFVSPANSLGFMDGGIDYAIKEIKITDFVF